GGRIPKIRPVQLRISGLVDASTCCRGRWIKDNGVLSPIALWGLTSLYSVRHSSIFSRASSRSRNQCWPMALEPDRGVEAFHVGIVGRLAWAAEVQRDAIRIGP